MRALGILFGCLSAFGVAGALINQDSKRILPSLMLLGTSALFLRAARQARQRLLMRKPRE